MLRVETSQCDRFEMRRVGRFLWGVLKAIGRVLALLLAAVGSSSGRSRLPNPDQRRDYDRASSDERRRLWRESRPGR
jgi:hypothetical protein